MNIFNRKKSPDERTVKDCIELVEMFLRKVGLDPKAHRLPDSNSIGWLITRGSAKVFIFIGHMDNRNTLEIRSPILHIPSQNILPFYRKCLEINNEIVGCAISVFEDRVFVLAARFVEGLDYKEVESMVDYTALAADYMDNKLAEEFGAKLWTGS